MNEEYLYFIQENEHIFRGNISVSREVAEYVYEIYNAITGEKKKPNGCGRCWMSVKNRIWAEYNRLNNLF